MRAIKFRAWDKDLHQWKVFEELPALAIYNSYELRHDFENWCQYTGLKDRQGKEIYEGDIIRDYTFDRKEPFYKGFVVKMGVFGWLNVGHHYNSEVTGNIYENPVLLK